MGGASFAGKGRLYTWEWSLMRKISPPIRERPEVAFHFRSALGRESGGRRTLTCRPGSVDFAQQDVQLLWILLWVVIPRVRRLVLLLMECSLPPWAKVAFDLVATCGSGWGRMDTAGVLWCVLLLRTRGPAPGIEVDLLKWIALCRLSDGTFLVTLMAGCERQ